MEFLSQRGVPFEARDVRADPAARDELLGMGFRSTPVVVVGDEKVVGFNRARLEQLLFGTGGSG